MILPDVNLLLHAHNSESPCHEAARHWWDAALAGTEGVGLAWVTTLGFVRLATSRRVFFHPMTPAEALSRVGEWLSLPHVHPVPETRVHFETLRSLLEMLGTAGNLTTVAHLAALAMTRGYGLHSCDADFARFPGLRWQNPLAGGRGT